MAAQHGLSHINLLPKESFQFSALGRILKWTITVGRVLVVMTEFVVILAFASRFYFDKKLNDLNDEISSKLNVIAAYAQVESQMRDVLARQGVIETAQRSSVNTADTIAKLSRLIPFGVTVDILQINGKKVSFNANAGSEALFSQTIYNFKTDPGVVGITLGQTTYDQSSGQVKFTLTVTYK